MALFSKQTPDEKILHAKSELNSLTKTIDKNIDTLNKQLEEVIEYGTEAYENGNEIIVDKMANMATYITTSIAQLKNHKADIMAQMICFETSTIMMDAIDTIAKLDVTSELYSPKALNKMKKTILKNTLQTEEFRRQIDDALSSTSAITTSSTASSAANEQAKILFKNRAAAKQADIAFAESVSATDTTA